MKKGKGRPKNITGKPNKYKYPKPNDRVYAEKKDIVYEAKVTTAYSTYVTGKNRKDATKKIEAMFSESNTNQNQKIREIELKEVDNAS